MLRLGQAINEVTAAFEAYRFTDATATLYRFFWSEYCDWYIESCKATFFGEDADRKANVLAVVDFVMGNTLRLFHPFLPFITEELWHGLGFSSDMPEDQGGRTIMTARWPKAFDTDFCELYGLDDTVDRLVGAKHGLVTQGRNLRAAYNIPFNKKIDYCFQPAGELDEYEVEVIRILLNAESVALGSDVPKGTPRIGSPMGDLFLPLEGLIDFDAERERLAKELKNRKRNRKGRIQAEQSEVRGARPAEVLEEQRERLTEWQAKRDQINEALEIFPPDEIRREKGNAGNGRRGSQGGRCDHVAQPLCREENQESTQRDIKLELDVKCQQKIESMLTRAHPEVAILGEEGNAGDIETTCAGSSIPSTAR